MFRMYSAAILSRYDVWRNYEVVLLSSYYNIVYCVWLLFNIMEL